MSPVLNIHQLHLRIKGFKKSKKAIKRHFYPLFNSAITKLKDYTTPFYLQPLLSQMFHCPLILQGEKKEGVEVIIITLKYPFVFTEF